MKTVIIILNYKNYKLTEKCINRLLELKIKNEIIIVDNNSKNGSFEYLNESFNEIENIRVIENNINSGYAKGNNFGIEHIEKDIENICIMNPDIYLEDCKTIEKLVNKMNEHKLDGITGMQILNGKYNQELSTWKLPKFLDVLIMNSAILSRIIKRDKYKEFNILKKDSEVALVEVMSGCFFIMKKQSFEKIGYFDTETFLYYEENIIASKAKLKQQKFGVMINELYSHNHMEKDEKLRCLREKIKDRKIILKSQKYFVYKYMNLKWYQKIIFNISQKINIYLSAPVFHIIKKII